MIEDDIYRTSSQFRLWSFTEASLQSLRATTNATACERVRSDIRKSRDAPQSASSSAAGTPAANPGSDVDSKAGEGSEDDCLTPAEEHQLVQYFCEQIIKLGEMYKPPLPTIVRATATQYLKRFYLTNSPMTYHPKNIMLCALFLATKTDNYYISLNQFAAGVPNDPKPDEIIRFEFLIMQSLRFTFDVRHPFRGLEGGIMELSAILEGLGKPAPHFPSQSPDELKRKLQSLSPPQGVQQGTSVQDRLARAHHGTREILKTAAQMTDAYFLYTPSQIWLAAFMVADRPLADFYLDTKLGGPVDENNKGNPFYELRVKLLRTLTDCANLLQSYTPPVSNQEQKNALRRIQKKLSRLQPRDKPEAVGQKRIPAAATDSGNSESEMERLAKKRKLDGAQANDLFGGELVMQRTKQTQGQQPPP
ncbi:cyclin-like protein [Aspergillus avenaceus]|uniref:RNA polymerase II holoenzyme cyclin-like subunit n=1 Tax=Aspergillus avenaceus TaxID=36643 RepID=A0A5N6U4L7_ASPAV|nr:cyclin-like protein [Aspergillus avenaceus]